MTITSPLHPTHCADSMRQIQTAIVHSRQIARSTHLVRVTAPEIAKQIRPGQFVMIRMAAANDPLIGRAFAVYDVHDGDDGKPSDVDLVYLRKGNLTTALADAPEGTEVSLWGPLGNGFGTRRCRELVIAVGGIGQTPMLLLGRDALGNGNDYTNRRSDPSMSWADKVTILYGARTGDLLAGQDDFADAGMDVQLCTDDGSVGREIRVPDLLREHLDRRIDQGVAPEDLHVVTCGPEIMMQLASEVCRDRNVSCQVSMETPMACGIGICYSCVAKIRQPEGDWDYKRTCVEGPVFDAQDVVW